MDKLKAMTAFVRIVESGSLTAAAQRLDVSLTAVVRSLAALERALGVRLLNRTTRRLALTDEGREYFERCRRVLAEVEEMESALTERRLQPGGRLVITAPVMFGRLHVAPLVAGFVAAYPALRAELLLLDRVIDLLEEGVDLAIRIAPLPDSSLVAVALGHTARVLCASPEYLARHGEPRHPRELASHRAVRFTGLSGAEWGFARGAESLRVAVPEVLASNQVDAVLEACRQGLGLGRFLGYQSRALEDAGQLVRVLREWEPPPVQVSLVHAQARLLSPRIRAFMDWAVPRLRERLA
ncbi:LysR family transcriptional regulator [Azohydromonas caseinilytica]|uniref:LysR family transcriptional regulator n=1 Tax=Azohydromonas caseinilytica TaxID=2728836 RepID=A0A848F6A0_9BURK|nr:LysR family transcriptional regulator [Azohydromonas caseinilytica]NML14688.1 LysR family transcriptional regulator [Azohydromonas caseinilytica]